MDKNAKPDKAPQTSPEAPFTTFIRLDGRSTVPAQFRVPGTFTITRLQSPAGLPDRITKVSPVPALLVSISLKSLASSRYQVWTADKLIATSIVYGFQSYAVIDASGGFTQTQVDMGILRMQQAGVIPVCYSNVAVEILADNAAPEAEAVYGALGMPFSGLVFGLKQYFSRS
jgi:hypothetical protein